MLTDSELDRYARHIILPQIGGQGQARLKSARVAVIGAGGLGSPCLLYLAAAGVGHLTIIDDDDVALSNLQRQILFTTADTGRPKPDAAAERLAALNPHTQVTPVTTRLTPDNAHRLLANHTQIADGCDSFATRLAVSDAATALEIPLVSGAVGAFDGQLATFRGHDPALPCYRCLVGNPEARPDANCAATGILGALTGVIGALMALEVIREITDFGETLAGRLLLYDALSARIRTIRLPKDPYCPGCRPASL